eukprot:gene157-biopygen8997
MRVGAVTRTTGVIRPPLPPLSPSTTTQTAAAASARPAQWADAAPASPVHSCWVGGSGGCVAGQKSRGGARSIRSRSSVLGVFGGDAQVLGKSWVTRVVGPNLTFYNAGDYPHTACERVRRMLVTPHLSAESSAKGWKGATCRAPVPTPPPSPAPPTSRVTFPKSKNDITKATSLAYAPAADRVRVRVPQPARRHAVHGPPSGMIHRLSQALALALLPSLITHYSLLIGIGKRGAQMLWRGRLAFCVNRRGGVRSGRSPAPRPAGRGALRAALRARFRGRAGVPRGDEGADPSLWLRPPPPSAVVQTPWRGVRGLAVGGIRVRPPAAFVLDRRELGLRARAGGVEGRRALGARPGRAHPGHASAVGGFSGESRDGLPGGSGPIPRNLWGGSGMLGDAWGGHPLGECPRDFWGAPGHSRESMGSPFPNGNCRCLTPAPPTPAPRQWLRSHLRTSVTDLRVPPPPLLGGLVRGVPEGGGFVDVSAAAGAALRVAQRHATQRLNEHAQPPALRLQR